MRVKLAGARFASNAEKQTIGYAKPAQHDPGDHGLGKAVGIPRRVARRQLHHLRDLSCPALLRLVDQRQPGLEPDRNPEPRHQALERHCENQQLGQAQAQPDWKKPKLNEQRVMPEKARRLYQQAEHEIRDLAALN